MTKCALTSHDLQNGSQPLGCLGGPQPHPQPKAPPREGAGHHAARPVSASWSPAVTFPALFFLISETLTVTARFPLETVFPKPPRFARHLSGLRWSVATTPGTWI